MSVEPGELQGVEVRHLEAFVLLAEELNFTRAAERLHIAQQALSSRISQLEERLGVELFRRDKRTVELSAAGEAFRPRAEQALAEIAGAVSAVAQVKSGKAGRLVIGLTSMTSLTSAQELIRRFSADHPEVDVEVRTVPWPDPSAGVVGGHVDIGVVRPPFTGEGVRLHTLLSEPIVAVLPADHPLAGSAEVRAEQIVDEPWVHLPDTDPAFEEFWTLAAHRDGPKRIGAVIGDFDELFMAVSARGSIGTVPGDVAQALAGAWPGLSFVPVSDAEPCTVAVAWQADRETPLVRAFVEMARREADGGEPLSPAT
ncbi:MAG TPA: LysR family transcriptional regulator [Thermoleophilaceae bacterium]